MTVSLRKPYVSSICSSFFLSMEWNASEKSTYNLRVALNSVDFRLDTIKNQGVLNLCSYSNKSYVPVVLKDSVITFLRKGNEAAVCLFIVFCLYTALYNRRNISSNFLVFHTSGCISSRSAAFLFLFYFFFIFIFFSNTSSSSSVFCFCLMYCWYWYFFSRFISNSRSVSWSENEKTCKQ